MRLIRATISALFTHALDHELVTANRALKMGKARKADDGDAGEKVKAMSAAELVDFLKVAARDRLAEFYLFLVDTGVRPGEACAIQWQDIDLVAKTAHIHASIERRTKRGEIDEDEDGSVRRSDAARLVKGLDALQTRREVEAPSAGREATPLVFLDDHGRVLDSHNANRRFMAWYIAPASSDSRFTAPGTPTPPIF